jgi:hypothetical protein
MLVTLVAFLGLSVPGIVVVLEGHPLGSVLNLAGIAVAAAFHRWSRRRWAAQPVPDTARRVRTSRDPKA